MFIRESPSGFSSGSFSFANLVLTTIHKYTIQHYELKNLEHGSKTLNNNVHNTLLKLVKIVKRYIKNQLKNGK